MTTAIIESTVFAETIIAAPAEACFSAFTNRLYEWWPRAYTWSQDGLQQLGIDPVVNGKCFENGPFSFRYDWGRVLEVEEPVLLVFTWQIAPNRHPEPDPEKASIVRVTFKTLEDKSVRVRLIHSEFERHGEGWEDYEKAMNSPQGWPYILEQYRHFLGKNAQH